MFQRIFFRNCSTKSINLKIYPPVNSVKNRNLVESITESRDQQAFLAWHPKKEIPYECTKPLPTFEKQVSNSIVKEEIMEMANKAYKHQYPDLVRENLSNLTFTTKHRWFPRARDKKAKKTVMDRPYL